MNSNPLANTRHFLRQIEIKHNVKFSLEVWEKLENSPLDPFGLGDIQCDNPVAKALIFWTMNGGTRETFAALVGPESFERARRDAINALMK